MRLISDILELAWRTGAITTVVFATLYISSELDRISERILFLLLLLTTAAAAWMFAKNNT